MDAAKATTVAGFWQRSVTDRPARTALVLLLLFAWAIRFSVAVLSPSIFWPDEIYQVLEYAHRMVFGYGLKTWDWDAGVRSPVPPALFMPLLFLAKGLQWDAAAYLALIQAFLCALSLLIVWVAYRSDADWRRGLVMAVPAAVWFEMLLFAAHPLLDVLAAPALVLGIYLLRKDGGRAKFCAGILLGIAVCLRPALAPAIALGAIMGLGRDWRAWMMLVLGGLSAALPYGLADMAVGQPPFGSILAYAQIGLQLIHQGGREALLNAAPVNVEEVGATPWNQLISGLIYSWGSALPFLLILLAVGGKRNGIWIVAGFAVIATYSLIPHREYRYIYPALACLMIPIGVGLQRAVDAMIRLEVAPAGSIPRIAALIMIVCSATAARMPTMAAEWHHGSTGLATFAELRKEPAMCGVAATRDTPLVYTGGYTVLHRNIPLFDGVGDPAKDAAYYSDILTGRKRGDLPASFRLVSCQTSPHADWKNAPTMICHYRRAGSCKPPDDAGPSLEGQRLTPARP